MIEKLLRSTIYLIPGMHSILIEEIVVLIEQLLTLFGRVAAASLIDTLNRHGIDCNPTSFRAQQRTIPKSDTVNG